MPKGRPGFESSHNRARPPGIWPTLDTARFVGTAVNPWTPEGSRLESKSMATRLKDIAQDLNLSVVTVSKVLRDHPDIGHRTRERVLQRMKELDYRPNLAARALVTGRTYAVGLIVPDLVHPFFGEVAKALSSVLRVNGYSLVLSASEDDPNFEQQEIDQLLARRVDVLIVASVQQQGDGFRRIQEQK